MIIADDLRGSESLVPAKKIMTWKATKRNDFGTPEE